MIDFSDSRTDKPVALFGATGVTGRLVVEEFKRANWNLRLVGRNEIELKRLAKETGFDFKTVCIDQSDSVKEAMSGASVVINCVGPFNLYGDLVVRSACDLGIHYIDTTGEQSFICQTYQRYSALAKEKGIAVAPACAFEYAISDTLAELTHGGSEDAFDFEVYYLLKGAATSVGTRRSFFGQLSQPFLRYQDGRLGPIETLHFLNKVTMPDGNDLRVSEFGAGESLFFPLHLNTKNVRSFLATNESSFPSFKLKPAFLKGLVQMPVIGDLLKAALIAEGAPSKEKLEANSATVILIARAGTKAVTSVARATDPYALTAVIAAALAEKLRVDGARSPGFCAPSMVAGADFIKASTEARGVIWPS